MKKKGFTLIEIMVLLVIIGLLLVIVVPIITDGRCSSSKDIQTTAMQFVGFKYPDAQNIRIQCQDYDSDQNGYISCEAAFDVDGQMGELVFECPTPVSFNSRCRSRLY